MTSLTLPRQSGWPVAGNARISTFARQLGCRSLLLPTTAGWADAGGILYRTGGVGAVETAPVGGALSRRSLGGGAWSDFLLDRGYLDPGEGYWWVFRSRLIAVAGNWGGILARTQDNSTASGWAWQRTNSDQLYVYHGGSNWYLGVSMSSLVDGEDHVLLGLWRKAESRLELWRDGKLFAAANGITTAPPYAAGQGQLKILSSRDVPNINGSVAMVAVGMGGLSAGAAAAISGDAGLLFARPRQALYFDVGGSGSGAQNLSGNAQAVSAATGALAVESSAVALAGLAQAEATAGAALTAQAVKALTGAATTGHTEYATPQSDLVSIGATSTEASLFEALAGPDDASYITVPVGAVARVSLSAVADPVLHPGHRVRFRLWGGSAGGVVSVSLKQVDTTVAYLLCNDAVTDPTTLEFTLALTDAAKITDYSALGLQFYTSAGSAPYYFSWAEFSVEPAGVGATGTLSAEPTTGEVSLSGEAAAAATAAGILTHSVPLAAAGLAVATSGGAMSISIPLAGAAAAQSGAPGTLSVTGNAGLTGAATATANASGGLALSIPLSAAAVSQALAAAGLAHSVPLSAEALAQSLASAALETAGTVALSAAAVASALVSASLSHGVPLTAAAAAEAVVAADLSHGVPLASEALIEAFASATLSKSAALTSLATSEAIASAALSLSAVLAASASATSAAAGGLSINLSLSGIAVAEAAALATLATQPGSSLAGAASAQASASGAMTHGVPLSGAALTVSGASGNITQIVPIQSAAASASLATGGLDVVVRLDGGALAQALAEGGITHVIAAMLDGSASGDASASGSLTLRINLDGGALAQAVASGALTAQGRMYGATPGWSTSLDRRNWSTRLAARGWGVSAPRRNWSVSR